MFKSMSMADVLAGVALAGLLLPEAVAYSTIAGLPPQAGVVALFGGLCCYGLFGLSRFAVVSATSSSAAVVAVAATTLAAGDLGLRLIFATGLVLMTGAFFLVAGLARVGSISDFIAKPVLRGFAFGLAIVIILKQLADVVGVHPAHNDVPRFAFALFNQLTSWNLAAGGVGLIALTLLFLLARLPRVPGAILVVIGGIVAEHVWHISSHGIGLVGPIDVRLQIPVLPSLAYGDWLRAGELSAALALILYAESFSSIRTFAMKHGDRVAPNRDLLALGMANLASALFQGMPVGAGYSATAANEAGGATSRLAGLYAALTVLILVLTALPLIALTPKPILAAIVIHAVSHTLRPQVFRPYFLWHRDRLLIALAFAAVLLLGVLDGLLAAIVVSLLMLLRRLAASSVTVLGRLGDSHDFVSQAIYPAAQSTPGLIILRPDAALFFANADRVLTQARHVIEATDSTCRAVVLSLEESPDLDGSTIEALGEFTSALRLAGKNLFLARLKPAARDALVRAALPGQDLAALMDLSVDDAVRVAQQGAVNAAMICPKI